MKTPDLETLLRAWGRYYGERAPKEWDEGEDESQLTISHPLARAMEFAGGHEPISLRAARGMRKIRGTPTWGFDPVACAETRTHRISTPDDVPPTVQRVQRAALELYRMDTMRGTVLRFEYCKRGRQADKCGALSALGFPMGLRMYREALANAKGWMEGRLFGVEW